MGTTWPQHRYNNSMTQQKQQQILLVEKNSVATKKQQNYRHPINTQISLKQQLQQLRLQQQQTQQQQQTKAKGFLSSTGNNLHSIQRRKLSSAAVKTLTKAAAISLKQQQRQQQYQSLPTFLVKRVTVINTQSSLKTISAPKVFRRQQQQLQQLRLRRQQRRFNLKLANHFHHRQIRQPNRNQHVPKGKRGSQRLRGQIPSGRTISSSRHQPQLMLLILSLSMRQTGKEINCQQQQQHQTFRGVESHPKIGSQVLMTLLLTLTVKCCRVTAVDATEVRQHSSRSCPHSPFIATQHKQQQQQRGKPNTMIMSTMARKSGNRPSPNQKLKQQVLPQKMKEKSLKKMSALTIEFPQAIAMMVVRVRRKFAKAYLQGFIRKSSMKLQVPNNILRGIKKIIKQQEQQQHAATISTQRMQHAMLLRNVFKKNQNIKRKLQKSFDFENKYYRHNINNNNKNHTNHVYLPLMQQKQQQQQLLQQHFLSDTARQLTMFINMTSRMLQQHLNCMQINAPRDNESFTLTTTTTKPKFIISSKNTQCLPSATAASAATPRIPDVLPALVQLVLWAVFVRVHLVLLWIFKNSLAPFFRSLSFSICCHYSMQNVSVAERRQAALNASICCGSRAFMSNSAMVAVAICCILVLLAVFIIIIIVVGQTMGEPK